MALGLPCRDALLICADEQVLGQGVDKFLEERISCVDLFGSVMVSSYGGSPGLWREANDKIATRLLQIQGPEEEGDVCITPHAVYEAADEIFKDMGRPLNLQMLIGIGGVFNAPELFLFDQGAMQRANGFTCVGVGELSIIRYLAETLYSPTMPLEAAKNLGIYMISKAAQYVTGVGAPIDAVVIAGHQPEWLGDTEIKEREAAMLAREKALLKQILNPPHSSSTSWP